MNRRDDNSEYFIRCKLTEAGFVAGNVTQTPDLASGSVIFTQEIEDGEEADEEGCDGDTF
jgi:hypothetical protein